MTAENNTGNTSLVLPLFIFIATFVMAWSWFYLVSLTPQSPAWPHLESLGATWRRTFQIGVFIIPVLLPIAGIFCFRAEWNSRLCRYLYLSAFVASLLPFIVLICLGAASRLGMTQ